MRAALGLAAALVVIAAPVVAAAPRIFTWPTFPAEQPTEVGTVAMVAQVLTAQGWRTIDGLLVVPEVPPAVCAPLPAPTGAG